MTTRLRAQLLVIGMVALPATLAHAGKFGFADKPGGGKDDPIIEVSASVGPNLGERMSRTEDEMNALYRFDTNQSTFQVTQPPPVMPPAAGGANQFIRVRFPFKIANKKRRKSIMKPKAIFADTSFLTPNVTITDEQGLHVKGIATIRGKDAFKVKRSNDPFFPVWLGDNGKNLLNQKKSFVYIADDGDNDLSTIEAFGATGGAASPLKEIRVRVNEVAGVTINGFWVIKIGDGSGTNTPAPGQPPLLLSDVTAKAPVTPAEVDENGNPIVETFSKYVVKYTETVVPWSVGFSADSVKEFNATDPDIALVYNGNTGPVPNVDVTLLGFPFFPNFQVLATANGVNFYTVPVDIRPINPNNLSEYVINPILDLPGESVVSLNTLPLTLNANLTPNGQAVASAVTSFYNVQFDDSVDNSRSFKTNKGRAFVNVPVSPAAIYVVPASGSGVGAINLDGHGFETNDPAVNRLLILTNNAVMCSCTVLPGLLAGSHLLGCNGNTFGDASGANPIGIAGNPDGTHLGPSTPIPGVNEGSAGSTANAGNPFGIFPPGFETVCRDSKGNNRLARNPDVGAISDLGVGGFLDELFADSLTPHNLVAYHQSFLMGNFMPSNSISDPPMPNPPPLRLPVGLPPVDVVFSNQKLLKPAFVIEADEVWSVCVGCTATSTCDPRGRVLLEPNPVNPLLGDVFPPYPQVGPIWQTFAPPPNPVVPASYYAARQQIGNFLYLADRDTGGLTVLNSNNFSVIDRIPLPDPEGVAVAPDLKRVYVSNFGTNALSIIDTDPFSGTFHQEVNRVKVGSGPRSVDVQPDNEDVFVCNFGDSSVSIVNVNTQTVRRTLNSAISLPISVVATPRHINHGWLNLIYFTYIGNLGTGTVVVYESGPDGPQGFGADDVRWAVQQSQPYEQIRGMTFDPYNYPGATVNLAGGVFVTHRDQETGLGMVTRAVFTAQLPVPGPFPPSALPGTLLSSPGIFQREFSEVAFWGGPLFQFSQQLNPGGQDQTPFDVALPDMTLENFHQTLFPSGYKTNVGAFPGTPTFTIGTITSNAGGPNSKHPLRQNIFGGVFPVILPDRMYVSFAGDDRIQVVDPNIGGGPINTIEGAPSPGELVTYFE